MVPEGATEIEMGLPFGEPCTSPAQCDSRICFSVDVSADGVCTQACDDNNNPCPDGRWACQGTASFGDICVPTDPKGLCAPCENDWECGSSDDLCMFGACATSCASDEECPSNFVCSATFSQCVPSDGVCEVVEELDTDLDGVPDDSDNCPQVSNAGQANADGDSYGDACDSCPLDDNEDQADSDLDGYGDACDLCPEDSDDQLDSDLDGYGDACDNCVATANPDQADNNMNGIGDLCEPTGEVIFVLGSPASVAHQGTAGGYTLLGGSFGARPSALSNASYTLHAFPIQALQR